MLKSRADPVAAMSFDPYQVAALREFAPGVQRGSAAGTAYTASKHGVLGLTRSF